MVGLLLRTAIAAFGMWLASQILPGMRFESGGTLAAAAFLLGIANGVVRPLLVVITLPITIVTLGLFLLVINAAMLGGVAALLPGFALDGFATALLGALIVSVTGWFASNFVGSDGRLERVGVVKGRRR
jgi:putative membrane protein